MKKHKEMAVFLAVLAVFAVVVAARKIWVSAELRARRYTMADMRSVAIALEDYAKANGGLYPAVARMSPSSTVGEIHQSEWRVPPAWPVPADQSVGSLTDPLVPRYIQWLPKADRWGNPFQFVVSEDRMHYTLLSLGSDGKLDGRHKRVWDEREFWRDIVLSDGNFISFPDGWSM